MDLARLGCSIILLARWRTICWHCIWWKVVPSIWRSLVKTAIYITNISARRNTPIGKAFGGGPLGRRPFDEGTLGGGPLGVVRGHLITITIVYEAIVWLGIRLYRRLLRRRPRLVGSVPHGWIPPRRVAHRGMTHRRIAHRGITHGRIAHRWMSYRWGIPTLPILKRHCFRFDVPNEDGRSCRQCRITVEWRVIVHCQ